jgi:hypothetical protein
MVVLSPMANIEPLSRAGTGKEKWRGQFLNRNPKGHKEHEGDTKRHEETRNLRLDSFEIGPTGIPLAGPIGQ